MDENIKIGQDVPLPKSNIQSLHTYESDIARAVRDNNGSLTKIAIAEQKRRDANLGKNIKIGLRKKNFSYLIMGLILIFVVFFSARFVMDLVNKKSMYQGSIEKVGTFFTVENQVILNSNLLVGREVSANVINNAFKTQPMLAGINAIFFEKENQLEKSKIFISTQEFIQKMQFSMSGALIRSLEDQMLIALYKNSTEENSHLLFLWSTKDYDQAFAGMLEYENAMFGDLFTLFGIKITDENNYLLNKKWEDILIENNDARILKYKDGTPLLYYMFLDRKIFIITDNIETIQEVAKRLRAQKLQN